MFETAVIATDGSGSADRAVAVALDVAERFEASVHAVSVVDERDVAGAPEEVREELRSALEETAEAAVAAVGEETGVPVSVAVREGDPAAEIVDYADEHDADLVALGTRGRHGDHAYVLGSVAESVVRRCDRPVLTVRQLEGEAEPA